MVRDQFPESGNPNKNKMRVFIEIQFRETIKRSSPDLTINNEYYPCYYWAALLEASEPLKCN